MDHGYTRAHGNPLRRSAAFGVQQRRVTALTAVSEFPIAPDAISSCIAATGAASAAFFSK
ncbi:hypothetical protein T05_5877 [Trichinella murrelli]|uniref:Uncharacterized protein n=1 Tax=Trichinella murrelli TaxID=144512 RepID=A0A0V0TF37_9BILA|nr:hypothetical protein T05_5877 [Trichinella murrelli]